MSLDLFAYYFSFVKDHSLLSSPFVEFQIFQRFCFGLIFLRQSVLNPVSNPPASASR